jgi:phosphatidylserine/phosphatidylglycerophosphate/cardiolipin synthase-like enzyme
MRNLNLQRFTATVLFAASLALATPAFAAAHDEVQVAFSPHGGAEALVLKTVDSARRSIRLMAYSFTAAPVVRALLDAKRRGVDVAVTVDYRSNVSEDRSGKARAALGTLANAGIPVRVVRAFSIAHSKYIVVDGETVETGSYNYSQQAARFNSENVLVLRARPDIARTYLQNWDEVTALGEPYVAP